MYELKRRTFLRVLVTGLCFLSIHSLTAMHGIESISIEGDGDRLRSFSSIHSDSEDSAYEHSDSEDSAYEHSGDSSPRSLSPTPYDTFRTKYSGVARLHFRTVGTGQRADDLVAPGLDEEHPTLTVMGRDAILHIAGSRAPRVLFDQQGNVLARDNATEGLSEAQKEFYKTVVREMQQARASYAVKALSAEQQEVERLCIESINQGLVQLHALETGSDKDSEKILEMQKSIRAMIQNMKEVIVPPVLPVSRGQVAPGLEQQKKAIESRDIEIDALLQEFGWQRDTIQKNKDRNIPVGLKSALKQIELVKDTAAELNEPLNATQVETIKMNQEKALAELYVAVGKKEMQVALKSSKQLISTIQEEVKQKQRLLKGKALAAFKSKTGYFLGQLRKAQEKLKLQSTYLNVSKVSEFEKSYSRAEKAFTDAYNDLREYLEKLPVNDPDEDPIRTPDRGNFSDSTPLVDSKAVIDFLNSSEGAGMFDQQVSALKFSIEAQPEARAVAQLFLEEDSVSNDLVQSLQKLKEQERNQSSKKIQKQILQQEVTLAKRIAQVLKQIKRVQGMLAKALANNKTMTVLAELGKEQRSWKARLLASSRNDTALAINLVRAFEKQAENEKQAQKNALQNLILWQQEADDGKLFFESSNLQAVSVEELRKVSGEVASKIEQVKRVGEVLSADANAYKKKEALVWRLQGWKDLVDGVLASRVGDKKALADYLDDVKNLMQSSNRALHFIEAKERSFREAKDLALMFKGQIELALKTLELLNIPDNYQDLLAKRSNLMKNLKDEQAFYDIQLKSQLSYEPRKPFYEGLNEGAGKGGADDDEDRVDASQKKSTHEQVRVVTPELERQISERLQELTLQSLERVLAAEEKQSSVSSLQFRQQIEGQLAELEALKIPPAYPDLEEKRLALIADLKGDQRAYFPDTHGKSVKSFDDEDDDFLFSEQSLDRNATEIALAINKREKQINELFLKLGFSSEDHLLSKEDNLLPYSDLPEDVKKNIGTTDYKILQLKLKNLLASKMDDLFIRRQDQLIEFLQKISPKITSEEK